MSRVITDNEEIAAKRETRAKCVFVNENGKGLKAPEYNTFFVVRSTLSELEQNHLLYGNKCLCYCHHAGADPSALGIPAVAE